MCACCMCAGCARALHVRALLTAHGCRWADFLVKCRELYVVVLVDFQSDAKGLGASQRQQGSINFCMHKVRRTCALLLCDVHG